MTRRGNVEKIILDFAKAVCEGERTMIDEKKVELMKKLQRLAERGVGGEKEGAQKKLQQLMKKYDIEESDLSDDKLEDHEWKYHNDFELRLLKQTIYKVLGFVKGRLKFGNSKQAAPFPSMVVIFRGAGM